MDAAGRDLTFQQRQSDPITRRVRIGVDLEVVVTSGCRSGPDSFNKDSGCDRGRKEMLLIDGGEEDEHAAKQATGIGLALKRATRDAHCEDGSPCQGCNAFRETP
jgi:hypothetical protein